VVRRLGLAGSLKLGPERGPKLKGGVSFYKIWVE